ncbi:elongation factor G [Membranicola marinus]|uniref:Tetracycline resistance protein TetQ n=1 Tax=Membranihabitans marinus TaxID=1227546 RepID=A0A953HLZ8_9BACT|nr:elongation factor G [Membranihabitans marinus]MBY5956963.1 elongation factor G [Membranihabitans marinus]
MKITTENLRNVVLLGHAGSGKTTFVENMLLETEAVNRLGEVEQGTTVSDYTNIEQEKQYSIFTSLMHVHWKSSKINIIDTPGADDFVGEVLSGLKVADLGVMMIHARYGVEVGTELSMEQAEKLNTPLLFVINHMDDHEANYEKSLQEIKNQLGSKVVPIQYPLNQGHGFDRIVDTLHRVVYHFPESGGRPEKEAIPESEMEKVDQWHNALVEVAAENDESLMEKYFEAGSLSEEELREGLNVALSHGEFYPVFIASAVHNMGSGRVMGFINDIGPSPSDRPPQPLIGGQALACDVEDATTLLIYKTISEPNVGNVSYFKVYSGVLSRGDVLTNANTGTHEIFNHIYFSNGKDREEIPRIIAGDLGVTTKLKNSHTNNTLNTKGIEREIEPIHFPSPQYRMAIVQENSSDLDKMARSLQTIQEEDPTLIVEQSAELNQTIIEGQGQLHLDIICYRLKKSFGVDLMLEPPRIPYRETISRTVEVSYRHKKQSGGAGQFAEVYLRMEPWDENTPLPTDLSVRKEETESLPWGGTLKFLWCIVGGNIDHRFSNAIKKGILMKMEEGPLTGSRCQNIQVCVFDGKMHSVDSNDMAFQLAAGHAFRRGFIKAGPQVLEPVYHLDIRCRDEVMGEIMGDLQSRRAQIVGMGTEGGYQKISATIPLAEMEGYSSVLRSLSQGKAKFKSKPLGYAQVSYEVQQSLVKENGAVA